MAEAERMSKFKERVDAVVNNTEVVVNSTDGSSPVYRFIESEEEFRCNRCRVDMGRGEVGDHVCE